MTIFYSGEPENLINTIATGGSEIRMIRRTEAFEFVANDNLEDIVKYAIKGENPSWTADQIKDEVRRLFYEASEYDSAGNLIKKVKATGRKYQDVLQQILRVMLTRFVQMQTLQEYMPLTNFLHGLMLLMTRLKWGDILKLICLL